MHYFNVLLKLAKQSVMQRFIIITLLKHFILLISDAPKKFLQQRLLNQTPQDFQSLVVY